MAEQANSEVKRLEELRDSIDWTDGDGLFYGRAALEHGLRMKAMQAEWANWLVREIDKRTRK
jgi:Virulence activator alpha C-term